MSGTHTQATQATPFSSQPDGSVTSSSNSSAANADHFTHSPTEFMRRFSGPLPKFKDEQEDVVNDDISVQCANDSFNAKIADLERKPKCNENMRQSLTDQAIAPIDLLAKELGVKTALGARCSVVPLEIKRDYVQSILGEIEHKLIMNCDDVDVLDEVFSDGKDEGADLCMCELRRGSRGSDFAQKYEASGLPLISSLGADFEHAYHEERKR